MKIKENIKNNNIMQKKTLALLFIIYILISLCYAADCNTESVSLSNCEIRNKTLTLIDKRFSEGNITLINANITLLNSEIDEKVFFYLYNSSIIIKDLKNGNIKIYGEKSYINISTKADLTDLLNISIINNSYLYLSSLNMQNNSNAYLSCKESNVIIYKSLMPNLVFEEKNCSLYALDSILNNKLSTVYNNLKDEIINNSYFFLLINNSSGIMLNGNIDYLIINNSKDINATLNSKGYIKSFNSDLNIKDSFILDRSYVYVERSNLSIEKSFFCTDADLYVFGIDANLKVNENYYRDIKNAYENNLIKDTNSDYRGDSGLNYPYKTDKIRVVNFQGDSLPVIADDIQCALKPIGKEAQIDIRTDYICQTKTLNISFYSLNFLTNADVVISNPLTGKAFEIKNTKNALINFNETGLYIITSKKGGYLSNTKQVLIYECGQIQEENETNILQIEIPSVIYVEEQLNGIIMLNNMPLKDWKLIINTPYGSINIKTDEKGKFSFIPFLEGNYTIIVEGIQGEKTFNALKKPMVYRNYAEISIKNKTSVTIMPSQPVNYSLEIKKGNETVFKISNVKNATKIDLEEGNYSITMTSNDKFSSILVNYEVSTEGFIIPLHYIPVSLISLLFVYLFLTRKNYKYIAKIEFSDKGIAKCLIKDFYNNPIKDKIIVLKDGDKIFSGFADEFGYFIFLSKEPGYYEILTKGGKIKNGTFLIKKIKDKNKENIVIEFIK